MTSRQLISDVATALLRAGRAPIRGHLSATVDVVVVVVVVVDDRRKRQRRGSRRPVAVVRRTSGDADAAAAGAAAVARRHADDGTDLRHRPAGHRHEAGHVLLALGRLPSVQGERDAVDAGVEDEHGRQRDPEVADLQKAVEERVLHVLNVALASRYRPLADEVLPTCGRTHTPDVGQCADVDWMSSVFCLQINDYICPVWRIEAIFKA